MIPSTVSRSSTEISKIAACCQCCGDGFDLYGLIASVVRIRHPNLKFIIWIQIQIQLEHHKTGNFIYRRALLSFGLEASPGSWKYFSETEIFVLFKLFFAKIWSSEMGQDAYSTKPRYRTGFTKSVCDSIVVTPFLFSSLPEE
jgi:hypothetical protein